MALNYLVAGPAMAATNCLTKDFLLSTLCQHAHMQLGHWCREEKRYLLWKEGLSSSHSRVSKLRGQVSCLRCYKDAKQNWKSPWRNKDTDFCFLSLNRELKWLHNVTSATLTSPYTPQAQLYVSSLFVVYQSGEFMYTSQNLKKKKNNQHLLNELIECFSLVTFKLVENLLVVHLFIEHLSHMKEKQRENRCTFLGICHFITSSQSSLLSQ